MKKKRRFPLPLAILLPLFAAILLGEIGLYLGAYYVLDETITDNAKADDSGDLHMVDNSFSEGNYNGVGYAVVPVIKCYEDNKPAEPFVKGSPEEKAYREKILKSMQGMLYNYAFQILSRYATDFLGIFYEDTAANRMVLVCSSNPVDENGDTLLEATSLYLGAFFDRTAVFDDPEFYGATVYDAYLGRMFASGLYMDEVQHPTQPDQYGGPYRVWLVRETKHEAVYAAIPLFTRSFAIYASVILVVLLLLAYLLLYLIVLRPAKKLSRAGNTYIAALKSGKNTKVFKPNSKRVKNEMTDLNDALYYTQEAISEYSEKLLESAAYTARVNADLRLAESIQSAMVPSAPLAGENYGVRGFMTPAREVGGDLYDYFKIDEEHIGFFIGDVSGKGVGAALFMARTQTMLHLLTDSLDITHVNALLCQGNDELLFVTAFIGVLNRKTGLLRYVNCGHEPAFLSHDKAYAPLKANANFALGLDETMEFPVEELTLSPGDRLFLYTDGISEAMDIEGNLFGKERILDALNGACEFSNDLLMTAMRESVADFVGEAEQSDDMCMLSLDYAREGYLPFEATLEGLAKVPPFIDEFLENESPAFIAAIQVILDELCSNVVHYGQVQDQTVYLSLRDDGNYVYGTIIDTGIPFDPTSGKTRERGEDEPGGYGILMAKSMSDDLYYRRSGKYNILRFAKKHS